MPKWPASTSVGHFKKSRLSRVYNRIESVASFEALVDLLYRALRKRSDIDILAYAPGVYG
jgi:hypothetical protein